MTRFPHNANRMKKFSIDIVTTAVREQVERIGFKKMTPEKVEKVALAVLMELMQSGSDRVRIAAAKAALQMMKKKEKQTVKPIEEAGDLESTDDARRSEIDERAAALVEVRALLAKIADAKSGGDGEPRALDRDRASGATDAPG